MSPATIIDGKAVAADVRADLVGEVAALRERLGRAPGLATVLVGDDGASQIYVRRKHEACAEVGIESIGHELGAGTSQRELEALVDRLNADDAVDGILVQLPLPGHIDSTRIVNRIDAAKDVDGLTTSSAGLLTQVQPGLVPCTPAGVMELLRGHGTELRGAEGARVGRSGLGGRTL
ncbi:MAG: tetrahydrofolate dehydrogenase/cyclohydrolase catalytic domain-containing protein, partial [Solirubrobacterales bacterium]